MKMNKKVINLLLMFLITFSILISIHIKAKAETLLESGFYTVNNTEKTITVVEPETDINVFKNKFNVKEEDIKIYKDKDKKQEIDQGIIGTGMYLYIENDMYLISVVGDIDGNGKAEQLDLTNIINHIVGLQGKELQGIYYKSADLTLDGKVDQRDITKFIRYIVIGELNLGKKDTTPPILELEVVSKSSNKIKLKAKALDKESGMGENPEFTFYFKKTIESNYVQIQKGTQANLELKNLEQNTEYDIKVETQDKSGNKAEKEIKVNTDMVPEIVENRDISFGNLEWNSGEAKLKVTTNSEYMIEHQVNSTTENWKKIDFSGNVGEIIGLHHNDVVYARLTDGNNSGKYITYTVKDTIKPTVALDLTSTTSQIEATATANDNESGLGANPTYTFYVKETSQPDSSYVQKQSNTNNVCTITGLSQNVSYTVKVEVKDVAENIGSATKDTTTSGVPDGTVTGNITFGSVTWNSGKATLPISTSTNYKIEYQVNSTTSNWITSSTNGGTVTVNNLNHNDVVYARLTDGTNSGNYATITIKDTIKPAVTLNLTSTTSQIEATATANDNESGLGANPTYTFYVKETSQPDSSYVQKQSNTNNVCTITGLSQNVSYTVKVEVKDVAENIGSATKDTTTSGVPDGTVTGNITFGSVTWNSGKATLPISTSTNYKIEYQVNSTTSNWITSSTNGGTVTVNNLNHNDVVYARLTDGTNSGNYATITIKDTIKPAVTLNLTSTTSQIEATATANDNESGLGANPTYTFYVKETSQPDSSYVQKQSNTNNVCTITGLSQNVSYTVKVEVKDVAENIGSATKDTTTSGVPDGTVTGNITFGSVTWNSGKATLPISTSTNYKIEYQVNSTTSNWITSSTNGGTVTVNNLNHNDVVYARLTDGTNSGNYATITIKDTIKPAVTLNLTSTTSQIEATATANDNESGLGANPTYTFYVKETSQPDSSYVQKQSNTNNVCTITGLSQNVSYTVKVEVKDVAENIGSATKDTTTSGVPDGTVTGNITFGSVTWNSGKATLPISTNKNYKIEYQVNSTTSNWTTSSISAGTVTVNNLNHNDVVYARLTDGTNSGNYATITIKDTIKPTVTLNLDTSEMSKIKATASAEDKESGIDSNVTYKFYIKEATELDSSYVQKQNTTSKTYTFTGLKQNMNYVIKVEVEDKAGNIGSTTKNVTTTGIPGGTETGAITFGEVQWNNSVASVAISTNTNYIIEYQVNSTEGEWLSGDMAGESVTAIFLNHNDVVYARLTDGTYYGNVATLTIKDSIKPQATITLSTNKIVQGEKIEASVTHTDNETGIDIESCRWVINQYGISIGTNAVYYTGGSFTKNNEQISTTVRDVGTFYVHVLSVDKAGNKKETVSEAITVEAPKTLASQVEVGDYVLYDATNDYSYESLRGTGQDGGNGYGTQNFTSSSDIKWRVFKIENEQVVLISAQPLKSNDDKYFTLKGGIGYLYAEQELNKICAIYGLGKGADRNMVFSYEIGDKEEGITSLETSGSGSRSVTAEEINKLVGYDPTKSTNYGNRYYRSVYYPTMRMTSGISAKRVSRSDENTSYSYKISDKQKENMGEKLFNLLAKDETGTQNVDRYWLASRSVYASKESADFGICSFDGTWNMGGSNTFSGGIGTNNEYERTWGIRPVVYMKKDILTGSKKDEGWNLIDKNINVPDATEDGAIKFEEVNWSDGVASVKINTDSLFKIQYQINSTEGEWTTIDGSITTVTNLKNEDIIYARLTNGTDFGNWATFEILDNVKPEQAEITLETKCAAVGRDITATVIQEDNQTGIDIAKSKWCYSTNSGNIGTDESKYVGGFFTSANEIITLSNNSTGKYYLHILSVDKAGNKTETISEPIDVITPGSMATKVNIGDYVAYDATDFYSYKSTSTNYEYKSSDADKWRVLSKDEATGEVVLINADYSCSSVPRAYNGANGYLYFEEEFNKASEIFGHGVGADTSKVFTYEIGDVVEGVTTEKITNSGARNLTMLDLEKILGIQSTQSERATFTLKYLLTLNEPHGYGYTFDILTRTYDISRKSSFEIPEEYSDILSSGTDNCYGIASRYVNGQDYSNNSYRVINYYVPGIKDKKIVFMSLHTAGYIYNSSSSEQGWTSSTPLIGSIKPIVYLKTTIQTDGKDSDGAWRIVDK